MNEIEQDTIAWHVNNLIESAYHAGRKDERKARVGSLDGLKIDAATLVAIKALSPPPIVVEQIADILREFDQEEMASFEEYARRIIASIPSVLALQERIDKLDAECERWIESQRIAFEQALSNGAKAYALQKRVKVLEGALRPFLPITVHNTPDYAELTFGDHQTQAMTMQPDDWLALNDAAPTTLNEDGCPAAEQRTHDSTSAVDD